MDFLGAGVGHSPDVTNIQKVTIWKALPTHLAALVKWQSVTVLKGIDLTHSSCLPEAFAPQNVSFFFPHLGNLTLGKIAEAHPCRLQCR